jgi:YkoY family integral membrane protein
MDMSLFLEYAWVLVVLVALEGLLAADNALVLAVMVKHLDEEKRKKALFYGLAGAFIFRLASLFIISFLVDVWQVQAIGALYLLYIAVSNIVKFVRRRGKTEEEIAAASDKPVKKSGFWATVIKVEVADIAFAIDSILAAVALAVALPASGIREIGGMDGGQFIVVFLGGFIGLVLMRFAANFFVKLLHSRPSLEVAAFVIVGWVGIKLLVHTLAHEKVHILSHDFAESAAWKATFYIVLVAIAVSGWFLSNPKKTAEVKGV